MITITKTKIFLMVSKIMLEFKFFLMFFRGSYLFFFSMFERSVDPLVISILQDE